MVSGDTVTREPGTGALDYPDLDPGSRARWVGRAGAGRSPRAPPTLLGPGLSHSPHWPLVLPSPFPWPGAPELPRHFGPLCLLPQGPAQSRPLGSVQGLSRGEGTSWEGCVQGGLAGSRWPGGGRMPREQAEPLLPHSRCCYLCSPVTAGCVLSAAVHAVFCPLGSAAQLVPAATASALGTALLRPPEPRLTQQPPVPGRNGCDAPVACPGSSSHDVTSP